MIRRAGHTGAGIADPHRMLHHRFATGRQGGEKIEGLTGIIEHLTERQPIRVMKSAPCARAWTKLRTRA